MNIFTKRMTISFMLALLMAVLVAYGGMQKKARSLYEEDPGQQSISAVFIKDIRIFSDNIPDATLAYDYYSSIDFPLPIAFSGIDERPF